MRENAMAPTTRRHSGHVLFIPCQETDPMDVVLRAPYRSPSRTHFLALGGHCNDDVYAQLFHKITQSSIVSADPGIPLVPDLANLPRRVFLCYGGVKARNCPSVDLPPNNLEITSAGNDPVEKISI